MFSASTLRPTPLWLGVSILCTAMLLPTRAHGELIALGDLTTGMIGGVKVGPPSATFDLCAFSEQTMPAAAGPNAGSSEANSRTFGNATQIDSPQDFKATTACDNPNTFMVGAVAYGPPLVGFRARDKPAAPGTDLVQSLSGFFIGAAAQSIDAGPPLSLILNAVGRRVPAAPVGAAGRAAGQAIDPVLLDAGLYRYNPVIDVELATEAPGDFAGVEFFATDSRFSDPLWFLGIYISGLLLSSNDLQVAFDSAPLLGLINADVESLVRAAFVVGAGQATLSSHSLFDVNYSVNQTITFSEGTEAGIVAVPVPEPGTLRLLAMALGFVLVSGWKRRLRTNVLVRAVVKTMEPE